MSHPTNQHHPTHQILPHYFMPSGLGGRHLSLERSLKIAGAQSHKSRSGTSAASGFLSLFFGRGQQKHPHCQQRSRNVEIKTPSTSNTLGFQTPNLRMDHWTPKKYTIQAPFTFGGITGRLREIHQIHQTNPRHAAIPPEVMCFLGMFLGGSRHTTNPQAIVFSPPGCL